MKRIAYVVLVVSAFLIMAGCQLQGLNTNLFSAFGAPKYPQSVSDVNTLIAQDQGNPQAFIDSVSNMTSSKTFYANLDSNPNKTAIVDAITTQLATIYNSSSASSTERVQAANLSANINLQSSGGQLAVNNVTDTMFTLIDGSTNITSGDSFITTVIGSAFKGITNAAAALEGVAKAGAAYSAVGSLLVSTPIKSIASRAAATRQTAGTVSGNRSTMDPATAFQLVFTYAVEEYIVQRGEFLPGKPNETSWDYVVRSLENIASTYNTDPAVKQAVHNTVVFLNGSAIFLQALDAAGLTTFWNKYVTPNL